MELIILFTLFFIMFLIALAFIKMERVKKQRKQQTFIINDKPVYLTRAEIAEVLRKNYGTHSWHRKTKRK